MNYTETASAITQDQRLNAERAIRNGGRVSVGNFRIIAIGFCSVALLTCLVRITIRLSSRKRIFLDDVFIIFAALCLLAATALCYNIIYITYLWRAALQDDPIQRQVANETLATLTLRARTDVAYFILLWVTICAVKFSYLALFRLLLRGFSWKARWYFWFCVVLTVATLVTGAVGMQTIACPSFKGKADCFMRTEHLRIPLVAYFWLVTVLDWLTGLMIINIPVLILRQSQLQTITKIGLSLFLCLSIFMLICTVIRVVGMAGAHNVPRLDYPWQVFWLHAEAGVGVIMASMTAYRAALVGSSETPPENTQVRNLSRFERDLEKLSESPLPDTRCGVRFGLDAVQIPRATLADMHTMLGNRVQERQMTNRTSMAVSELEAIETDYHVYIGHGPAT